ncbi:MAG TPA: response regulator [Myxococcaceae bacterium]|nr:response regulator [Myxococcaceae bacterium]
MANPGSLLVIDDDHDILLSLQDVLEVEGYRVITASSGREALEYLREGLRPDLILLDLMMPEVSGWAFRARQRVDPAVASIPVVVVSGQGLSAQQVSQLGVAGYLPKPVDLDMLLDTVARFTSPHEHQEVASW